MKNIPQWVRDREKANEPIGEVIIVSQTGVDGVYDGKLPSGEDYVYQKKVDKIKRKIYE